MRASVTKRVLSMAAVAALAFGALGMGPPDVEDIPGNPGPNGHNNFGLCTAYFSGSDNGQENKRKAPPFQALENEARDDDSNDPIEDQVAEWCADNAPHPSENGNGNGS